MNNNVGGVQNINPNIPSISKTEQLATSLYKTNKIIPKINPSKNKTLQLF